MRIKNNISKIISTISIESKSEMIYWDTKRINILKIFN